MKYTIVFVFAALAMSIILLACSSSKNNNTDSENEAALERKSVESSIDIKILSHKWKHVKTKDSYDDIWKDVETDNKVITFTESGEYTENKPGNDLCTGTYALRGENVVMNHSCNTVELSSKVVSLEEEKLVLGMRGRHGEVLYVYEKVK